MSLTNFRFGKLIWPLSAIDGLLLGVAMEFLFVKVYYNWEFKRATDYAQRVGSDIPVERGSIVLHNAYVIPLLCVIMFAFATLLLRRAMRYPRITSLVFWELIAFVGMTLSFVAYFSPLFYRLGRYLNEPAVQYDFLGLAWAWIVCLAVAAIINLFLGRIIQSTFSMDE